MKTLISSTEGLLFVILLMVAFSLWLQRYKVFRSLGPVLTVVIIGIVLSNTHCRYHMICTAQFLIIVYRQEFPSVC